jgi:hypothetical protein
MNLRMAILYFRCNRMKCLGNLYRTCAPLGKGIGKSIGEKLALEKGA